LLPVAKKKKRLLLRLQHQPLLQPLLLSPHRQHLLLTQHLQHLQHLLLKKRKKKRSNSFFLDRKAGALSAGFFSPKPLGRAPIEASLLISNHQ
jgi:hypothetical protein